MILYSNNQFNKPLCSWNFYSGYFSLIIIGLCSGKQIQIFFELHAKLRFIIMLVLNKKMDSNKNRPILNIDNAEYYIDSLPDEGKGLVNGLRTADAQLKMYEDTLKMINIGKIKMLEDLKKIVENIEPLKK